MIDPKTQALIIKYLRKAWLYSPARREALKRAESGKDAQGEKLYSCAIAEGSKEAHQVSKVYVDHKRSFIPLSGFDSWDGIIGRLFDVENEQCLCKIHHAAKTKKENLERKRVKKNGKI